MIFTEHNRHGEFQHSLSIMTKLCTIIVHQADINQYFQCCMVSLNICTKLFKYGDI